jgi:hypothetical protein
MGVSAREYDVANIAVALIIDSFRPKDPRIASQ